MQMRRWLKDATQLVSAVVFQGEEDWSPTGSSVLTTTFDEDSCSDAVSLVGWRIPGW